MTPPHWVGRGSGPLSFLLVAQGGGSAPGPRIFTTQPLHLQTLFPSTKDRTRESERGRQAGVTGGEREHRPQATAA